MMGAPPVCSVCNDTHMMTLRDRDVMCTHCPVPCDACRDGRIGAFCAETPCLCGCHGQASPMAAATSVGPTYDPAAFDRLRGSGIAHLNALAAAVYEHVGHHGVTRLSLTPEAGLALGITPGTSVDVATSAGRVEVYAERAPRAAGTFTIDQRAPDDVDQVRAFADTLGDYVPRANARIAELEVETARLRSALAEALDAWAGWDRGVGHDHHAARIAELRKLAAGRGR